ncbi:MAG TPA: PepSY domain-containing protein [Polyangia bacterium]
MNIRKLFAVGTMIGAFALVTGCGGAGEPTAAATASLTSQQAISAAEAVYGDSATVKFHEEQAKAIELAGDNGAARSAWEVSFVGPEGEASSVVDARSGEIVSTQLVLNTCNPAYKPHCAGGKAPHCCGLDGGWSCFVCE